MNDIQIVTTLQRTISLEPKLLNKKINENLLKKFKNEFEGRCISEGYVIPDKTVLLKRTVGMSRGSHFSGDFKFDTLFRIELYNPVRDNIIDCSIHRINELGIQSIVGPMQIVIPKELHKDKSLFKNLKVGNKIKVKVIARRFDLYDTVIYITCKLAKDSGEITILKESDHVKKYMDDSDDDDEGVELEVQDEDDTSDNDDLISVSDEEEEEGEYGEEEEEVAEELADKSLVEEISDSEGENEVTDEEKNIKTIELDQEEFNYNSD